MVQEPAFQHVFEAITSSTLYGIPTIMLIICFKNCLEFKQRLHSDSRGLIQNFCLLLALGLGASIIIAILTGNQPAFMTSDSPLICYTMGYFCIIAMPNPMASLVSHIIWPMWMISRHISALNSDLHNHAALTFTGRAFLAFSNYSGGLLFISLFGAFDQKIMNYISSSIPHSLMVNGTLALVLVSTRSLIAKSQSVILLCILQETLKRLYQPLNSDGNAKILKKKLKVK